jgi:hypothetical protein
VGDATLNVSEPNDAQVDGAQAFQGDWDGVDIPLSANVILVISDRLVAPS